MVFLNAHGAMVPWWPQPAHVKDSLAATTSSYLLYKSDCEAKTNGSNGTGGHANTATVEGNTAECEGQTT